VANAVRVVPVLALAGVGTGLVLSMRAAHEDD
jgi:hypothetical protein